MIDNKEHFLFPAQKLGMKVIFLYRIDYNINSQLVRIKNLTEVLQFLKS